MLVGAEIVFESSDVEIHRKLEIKKGVWQSFVVIFKFFPEKGKFPLGWNGSRFAAGSEYDRLKNFSPEVLAQVEFFVRKHYSSGENEYKSIVEERDITRLIHFTKEKNLESIIRNGICVRDKFDNYNVHPLVNDQIRLDGYLDATSLSVSFPNSKMFYKYRSMSPKDSWVVLMLSPSLLWEMDCAFCKHNAADARIRSRNKFDLMSPKSLRGMFDEIPDFESRENQALRIFDPTDVQAEVLVFGMIDPSKIVGVAFSNPIERLTYEGLLNGRRSIFHADGRGYFSDRRQLRKSELGA